MIRSCQLNPPTGPRRCFGKTGGCQKWVVPGIQHNRRDPNSIQRPRAGAAIPIVLGIPESVERTGEGVVKLAKGGHALQGFHPDLPGKLSCLRPHLFTHVGQKPSHVEGAIRTGHAGCGGLQVARNRDAGTPTDSSGLIPQFGEVFQRQISTKAKAHHGHRRVIVNFHRMFHHGGEVLGGTAVVGAAESIGLAGTASEIPGDHVPTPTVKCTGHSLHVRPARISLQPVGKDDHPIESPRPAIQVEKITVGQFQTGSNPRHPTNPPKQRGPQRLKMGIPQPERRTITGVGINRHPG